MWKCSRCGTENDDSYDYCIVCGVEKNAPPLQSSSQAQQSQAQTHEEAKENESKENLQPKAEEIQANSFQLLLPRNLRRRKRCSDLL
jgi:hypothetical protein